MGRNDARIQPQCNQLASPVVRTGTGFHRDQAACGQHRTPEHELVSLQGFVCDHFANRIDGMNLNDILCQINTNSCNLAHGTSPSKGFRLTSKSNLGT